VRRTQSLRLRKTSSLRFSEGKGLFSIALI
jgi:hypothetical protein